MDRVCHPLPGGITKSYKNLRISSFFLSLRSPQFFSIKVVIRGGEFSWQPRKRPPNILAKQLRFWEIHTLKHVNSCSLSPSRSDVNVRLFFTFKQEQVKKMKKKERQMKKIQFMVFNNTSFFSQFKKPTIFWYQTIFWCQTYDMLSPFSNVEFLMSAEHLCCKDFL